MESKNVARVWRNLNIFHAKKLLNKLVEVLLENENLSIY